ncbi:MAG TPA: protein phosphatase 2C domain-containing protein [Gammaproteobacteria bacterium]|nr:protein phosphatase 2C domain-containing protein [Gammaproteobacteria bacterium]
MTNVQFGNGSHAGRVRELNEDRFVADPVAGLWLVADGMGGHECGEVASRIVSEFVRHEVHRGVPLAVALESAHRAVLRAPSEGMGKPGMGATVVAVHLHDACFELSWVGDSRGYLWNGTELTQLTRDHTLVQQLIDSGALSPADAVHHPHRNYVTQALGATGLDEVEVDTLEGCLYRGEQLLLCSDGLTGELRDGVIARVLGGAGSEQEKVDRLIELALEQGGTDNITVVLLSAPDTAPVREGASGGDA